MTSKNIFIVAAGFGLLLAISHARLSVATQPDDSEPSNHPVLLALDEILKIDSNCLSPCWWGFTLGETEQAEFHAFFSNLLSTFENDDNAHMTIRDSQIAVQGNVPPRGIYINFFVDQNIVEKITIFFQGNIIPRNELLTGYDLPEVMKAYGIPDNIFVNTQNDPPEGHAIALIYRDPLLMVEYLFRPDESIFYDVDNDLYLSCFPMDYMWMFRLFAGNFDFDEEIEIYERPESPLIPLEEISDFTIESFSQAILDGEQPCIALPAPEPIIP